MIRRRGARLVAALTASVMTLGAVAVTASSATAAALVSAVGVPGVHADDGASVLAETPVADGVVDLTVSSPALRGTGTTDGTTKVRLFLPTRWASAPGTRWPVLYLLHGANDAREYTSWDESTSVRAFLRGKDVLTVLPSGGQGGFYSDDWNGGKPGGLKWETFHTVELPQLLERGYRAGTRRAIAGVSMGGFGSLSYAARHPGYYGAAASYSGVVDTLAPTVPLVIVGTVRVRAGLPPFSLWGDPILGRARWAEHNPADLVARLKGTGVYVSTGDGLGGSVPSPDVPASLPIDFIEVYSKIDYDRFLARAKAAGVPVTSHYTPNGAHYWTFWMPEFERSWPLLAQGLGLDAQGRTT